ncbi:hypothetical protein [Streptomyces sp. PBH53]|nr:hypothetical protein [Streptomyces sp. PBH53]
MPWTSAQRAVRAAHRVRERPGPVRIPEPDRTPLPHRQDITPLVDELTL